jgi:hypothetical protein
MTQKPGTVSTTRLKMGSTTAFQLTPCHRCSYLARSPIVGNQVCLPNAIGPGPFPPIVGHYIVVQGRKSRTTLHIAAMTSIAGRFKPRTTSVLSQQSADHREVRAGQQSRR